MTIAEKIDRYMKAHNTNAPTAARKLGLKPWAAATWYKRFGAQTKTTKGTTKRIYKNRFASIGKTTTTGDVQAVIRRLEEAVAVLKVFS